MFVYLFETIGKYFARCAGRKFLGFEFLLAQLAFLALNVTHARRYDHKNAKKNNAGRHYTAPAVNAMYILIKKNCRGEAQREVYSEGKKRTTPERLSYLGLNHNCSEEFHSKRLTD